MSLFERDVDLGDALLQRIYQRPFWAAYGSWIYLFKHDSKSSYKHHSLIVEICEWPVLLLYKVITAEVSYDFTQ